ncbi:hypothetical protein SAMN03159496_00633 [Rhizobium sp. NFR07]|nr:hypothetical protein SAMN03159496_00633 [Rhizobium sp. NFR07]
MTAGRAIFETLFWIIIRIASSSQNPALVSSNRWACSFYPRYGPVIEMCYLWRKDCYKF